MRRPTDCAGCTMLQHPVGRRTALVAPCCSTPSHPYFAPSAENVKCPLARGARFSVPLPAIPQCHLVFDGKFNMMETAADVTIEERSLGRGGKQVVKQMWWHCGVLVTSAVAEVQLQCTTMLVIAGRGQRRGFQRHPALSGSRHRLASSAGEDLRKGKCPPRPQISRG